MLYAHTIWTEALSVGTTRRKLPSVNRLSAISGFRTVSDEAVLVLAETILIDILADVMRRIYLLRLECPERRTFYLVPYITPWMENKHWTC